MKVGKVSETVLKRSIFKQIRTKREEIVLGAGVGEDCAAIKLAKDETFVISTDPITGTVKDIGSLSVHITANDLASAGAEPVGLMLTVLLPEDIFESDLKEMMQQVEQTCSELNIQVMGGHTEITKAVNQPIISVTGVGKVKDGQLVSTGGAKAGQDIVVSKWVGIEGTSIIAKENEIELLGKYPKSLIENAKSFDKYISVVKEAAQAVKSGVSAMHDVTEGGIYGALWEMAQASGVGLEIDLKKIPIKQETIEICEFYDLNPYCLISSGCMLMAIDNGYDLVRSLEKIGISATVIGKAMNGNDRVIINDDERRFLEPPKSDELYNVKSN
jgi:hydrogenase maturation factor